MKIKIHLKQRKKILKSLIKPKKYMQMYIEKMVNV